MSEKVTHSTGRTFQRWAVVDKGGRINLGSLSHFRRVACQKVAKDKWPIFVQNGYRCVRVKVRVTIQENQS